MITETTGATQRDLTPASPAKRITTQPTALDATRGEGRGAPTHLLLIKSSQHLLSIMETERNIIDCCACFLSSGQTAL